MSYSDDTIAWFWGYPEPRPTHGYTTWPWWKVIQRPIDGPGSVTNWFNSRRTAYEWAARLDGHVEIVGANWDEYEKSFG